MKYQPEKTEAQILALAKPESQDRNPPLKPLKTVTLLNSLLFPAIADAQALQSQACCGCRQYIWIIAVL